MRTLNGAVIHRLVGACALMLVAALAPASWGATIIVPDHFPTIQMAIDASSEGDEIMVRAGTYAENLTVPSGLTIRSTDPDDPAVVMQTIIDGSNSGRVISANFDDLPLVINGFVIANGNVGGLSSGGGLWVGVDGTIVKNCTFIGNDAASGGALGGSSNFTAVNCTFVGNSAISGGAVDLNAGCVLENCTFNGNSATDDGGAVWEPAGGGTSGATVINCRFFGNTAGHDGGGAWNNTESTWTNCTFGVSVRPTVFRPRGRRSASAFRLRSPQFFPAVGKQVGEI